MDEKKIKFSKGYVLRVTTKHMRKSIDISIRKTFARIKEHADDQEKSKEIFETLSVLHDMRRKLDEFQSENRVSFKD